MTASAYTCWLCGNLGALRRIDTAPDHLVHRARVWLPFRVDPIKGINLDRGEHVCPACHGSHNPHRTEFPIRDEAVDHLMAQRYNREYADLIVNRLAHIPGSAEVDDDEFDLPGDEPSDLPGEAHS